MIGVAVLVASRFEFFQLRDVTVLAATVREVRELPGIIWIFLAVYVLATACGLPATVFVLAGGAIFGLGLGFTLNWIGALLGTTGAYALARALGRPAIRALLPGRAAAVVDRLTQRHGFATLLRLRLLPIIPMNGLSFGSGLAGVRFRDFLPATAIGVLPAVFILTYFADAFLSGVEEAQRRAFLHIALAGCLLVVLSFAPEIRRRLSRRGRRQANGSPETASAPAFTDATSAEASGNQDPVSTSPQPPASPRISNASPSSPDRNGSRRGSPAHEDAQRT